MPSSTDSRQLRHLPNFEYLVYEAQRPLRLAKCVVLPILGSFITVADVDADPAGVRGRVVFIYTRHYA